MEFGIWLPVYGGWLRSLDAPTGPDVAACLAIAQQAEALGFDFLYASENLLNCIHGPRESVADAWSILAAMEPSQARSGLCGAVKPGFRSPFLVARMLDTMSKIAERRMGMNIVCGWWKEEFDLSDVEWLDHDGRYDRAANFYARFTGCSSLRPRSGIPAQVTRGRSMTSRSILHQATASTKAPPRDLDRRTFRSRRADGGRVGSLSFPQWHERRRTQATNRDCPPGSQQLGQDRLVAANAYVVATEAGEQARQRWKSVIARRNSETIDFFRKVIGRSGAAAWASLGEEQMVDSNAGFELGLIGSFEEIRQRIPKLQALGSTASSASSMTRCGTPDHS
jgi:FMNH2-dependent dimethyl sulfone monooxygenase